MASNGNGGMVSALRPLAQVALAGIAMGADLLIARGRSLAPGAPGAPDTTIADAERKHARKRSAKAARGPSAKG
jgi:hypothetical protein